MISRLRCGPTVFIFFSIISISTAPPLIHPPRNPCLSPSTASMMNCSIRPIEAMIAVELEEVTGARWQEPAGSNSGSIGS